MANSDVTRQEIEDLIRGNDAEDVTNLGGVIDMIHNKIVSGDSGEDEDGAGAAEREEVETA